MKNVEVILKKKMMIEFHLISLRELYSGLNQIDMLSSEGSTLIAEINKAEGAIMILNWVLE